MQPSDGDRSSSRGFWVSRREIRGLIATIREDISWSGGSEPTFPDSGAIAAMIGPVLTDPQRLAAVRAVTVAGKTRPDLDRMAMLAALALGTPFAAVTLIADDCQTLAGSYLGGTPLPVCVPLDQSLCRFTVATGEPFFIEDARHHPLSADNPLVRTGHLAAYAGVPLADHDRQAVGALACWDARPRFWTAGHAQILRELGNVAQTKMFGA